MSEMDPSKYLVWVDTETFGLEPAADPIIELGIIITTPDLDIVVDYSTAIWDDARDDRYCKNLPGDEFVLNMHKESGLWEDILNQTQPIAEPEEAYGRAIDFLYDYGVTPKTEAPMCGSSVQFDRGMLTVQAPQLASVFSHRNIDISSIKELCRRVNPDMYVHLAEDVKPKKKHRVLDDIIDTIGEAEWYLNNFMHHTLEAVRPNDKHRWGGNNA